jgi:large subunit ribosomal protein L22
MEARVIKRYIPSSPRKMRLVVDLIRGKSVEEALNLLHYNPKHASNVIELALKSAVSNLSNKSETGKVEEKNLFVKKIFVDGGPVLKRVMPAPQGRAFRKRKRSNHLTIIVEEREQK